jgi:hypothetical protein
MPHQTYQHFRRLDIAREALDLGARRSVVQQMTGISEGELRRVFGDCPALTTNWGGRPTSVEKLFQGRRLHLHASDFYNGFHHLLHRGVLPDEAMVVAYRHYQHRHAGDERLVFDRAFTVVTSVCRLWTTAAPSLKPMRCGACGALFLAPIGASERDETPCTYCKAAKRPHQYDGTAEEAGRSRCHGSRLEPDLGAAARRSGARPPAIQ